MLMKTKEEIKSIDDSNNQIQKDGNKESYFETYTEIS